MSKVFLVQNPSFRDQATGEWSPKYDVSAAKAFGEVVELLPPGNLPADLRPALRTMRSKLNGSDPFKTFDDYLLALGDPVAIALAVAVLMETRNRFSILKWDRRGKCYRSYAIDLN